MVGVKHGDASEGFSDDEISAILEVADGMKVWVLGVGDDPEFMGRLMRVLLYTGVHITNFCGRRAQTRYWYRGKPKDGDDPKAWTFDDTIGKWKRRVPMKAVRSLSSSSITETVANGKPRRVLVFRRVKKDSDNTTHIPVSSNLWPWLPAFLDQPKPKTRARYNQLLRKLQDELLGQKGMRLMLNPHRLRHTCMRLLHKEFGIPLASLRRIMATTEETLTKYAQETIGEIAADLEERGW